MMRTIVIDTPDEILGRAAFLFLLLPFSLGFGVVGNGGRRYPCRWLGAEGWRGQTCLHSLDVDSNLQNASHQHNLLVFGERTLKQSALLPLQFEQVRAIRT